ncbi:hypothetical protein OH460_07515 [Vibrio sp. Makdt]|uniref:hypothetical protein n=1 Tax=Vibrio sp. Makdt TaxID=2998828 RepID=UPI0022CD3400|nr:hypothetical protein [Vibrio sp. Makdt]MDA0152145.1 hypothetical protein [Vibrio sp. Makdt]
MFDYRNLDDLVNPNLTITSAKNHKVKATKMFYLYGFILTVVSTLSGSYAIGSLFIDELDKYTTATATPIAFLIFYLIDRMFYWSKVRNLFTDFLSGEPYNLTTLQPYNLTTLIKPTFV